MAVRQYREPIERSSASGGVTMKEIEARVEELCPDLTTDQLRSNVLLFAMLKEGKSIAKLHMYTKWPVEVLQEAVANIKDPGLRYTSAPSTQFVLSQVPGSEYLIEKITGQRIVRETTTHRAPAGYDWQRHVKATPIALPARPVGGSTNRKEESMNAAINGAAAAEAVETSAETCEKSASCGKPANHLGRCKGGGGSAGRERKKPNGQADQPKARAPKPAQTGPKLQTVTALAATGADGRFKIEYEDEKLTLNIEGIGREAFTATMEMIHASLTGGPNG